MFTNKLSTPKSRQNHYSSPLNVLNQSKKNINVFSQVKPSPFAQSSNLNRSVLQSTQKREDTTQHRLEPFGKTLSVLITEAIALADSSSNLDVCLSPSGWAWIIIGRKLFIWNYKPSAKASICKELSLPTSSIPYTSQMVVVLPCPDQHSLPGCVCVSAEGNIRYWPSILQEANFTDVSADVDAHNHCVAIISLKFKNCVIATDRSCLYLFSYADQSRLTCRELSTQRGMLSGIGRRVSSLFFGGGPTARTGAELHRILPGESMEDGSDSFYVLSGDYIEKWLVYGDSEKLLYQCEVARLLKECVTEAVWKHEHSKIFHLKTWLLDMQTTRDGLVILGAAVNPAVSDQLHYVLGTLHSDGLDSPQSFISFSVQKFSNTYDVSQESIVLDYHLLVADNIGSAAYIYTRKNVICTSVTTSNQPLDQVDFTTPGDLIIGVGSCDGVALFFSMIHGLVSILQNNAAANDSILNESSRFEPVTPKPLEMSTFVTQSKLEELSMSEDKTASLKAAFIQSCRGNQDQSAEIVSDLLDSIDTTSTVEMSMLDTLIVTLSQQLIDDFPAADPRWAETIPHDAASSSGSLILLRQLQDKLRSHQIYINFLKTADLWDKLSSIQIRNTVMCTNFVLCEHAEKITGTVALKNLHTQYTQIIDRAINKVLSNRGDTIPPSGLTPQDLFYRQVSKVQEILIVLQQLQDETLAANIPPNEAVKFITTVNNIFIGMLSEGIQYRETQSMTFTPTAPESNVVDYLPWTSSTGPQGMRTLLIKQHELTVQRAVLLAQDAEERGVLCEQLLQLADLLLDGFCLQLQKIRPSTQAAKHQELTQVYHQQRQNVIQPLMNFEQYERAASLAEKYCEFDVLIQLCEQTNNSDRLTRYLNQFHNKNFAEHVFHWYVKQGKRSKLLSPPLVNHPQLSSFLHTPDNRFVSWVHDLGNSEYLQAHKTLYELAVDEEENLAKKKTLYSLSKLCALAADDNQNDTTDKIDEINKAQDFILQQEALPTEVIENIGMDTESVKVLQPLELIELYIGDYNPNSSEFDFKKALDLLSSLNKDTNEPSYFETLLHIWCKAILKDDWNKLSLTDPLDSCKETVFFKTIELAYTQGMNLREYLPTVEKLLQMEELQELQDNTTFQFLLKSGYEKLQDTLMD